MAETAERQEMQRHLHRCQNCGVVWGHGHMMAGDVEAHKCPKCGKAEWRVYSGGGSHAAHTQTTQAVGVWMYLRAILPIAMLAAGIVLLSLTVLDWLSQRE